MRHWKGVSSKTAQLNSYPNFVRNLLWNNKEQINLYHLGYKLLNRGIVSFLFPFSTFTIIISIILAWGKLKQVPLLTLFLIGYTLSVEMFTGGAICWSYFLQFSHLGGILLNFKHE